MTSERMFIYGIFEGGKCLYVGHTCRLIRREYAHKRRFPGQQFKVLRETGSLGLKDERELIAEYRAKGEATHNKNMLPR
jgi:hypothetical protein